jgi:hypothetical protein
MACVAGNVAMATWLIAFGYEPDADETGYQLLVHARYADDVGSVIWILATFPVDISSDTLCDLIMYKCDLAPHAARYLIGAFDLTWSDVRRVYPALLAKLASATDARAQNLHQWLVARYSADSLFCPQN